MDEQKWKAKYQDALDQLEIREKHWQASDALLRQCLTRVALAAQGVDAGLDAELARLRKTITRPAVDPAQLEQVINAVSVSLTRLDEAREAAPGINRPQDLIIQWLDTLKLPAPLAQPMKQLRQIITQTGNIPGMFPPMRELAALLNSYFQQASVPHGRAGAPAAAPAGGLFKRLFGGGQPAGAETAVDNIQLLRDFSLQLMEKINLPADLEGRVGGIKTQLAQCASEEDLGASVSAIAGLISDLQQKMSDETRGLQDFLRQLTDNLQEIDQNLAGARSHQSASRDRGLSLGEAVHNQVSQIEASVGGSVNPALLKTQIQERLSAIRGHLEDFRKSEEQNQRELEDRLEKLNSRIHSMESESDLLRQRLREKHELAMKDPLTELPNRLAYRERLMQEYARSKRYGTPLVVMVADIDHFKKINDTYGHPAGDKALKLIAKVLRAQLRETDFLGRYGGEEFVILMPETSLEASLTVANKVREAVTSTKFHYEGSQVNITISAGLAALRQDDDTDGVFARADRALLKAKQNGRNRCEIGQD